MKNPLNDEDLSRKDARLVEQLRTVRRNARRLSRSGNPAVRVPAQRATVEAATMIRQVYVQAARGFSR